MLKIVLNTFKNSRNTVLMDVDDPHFKNDHYKKLKTCHTQHTYHRAVHNGH
jgi:hypothetical protein